MTNVTLNDVTPGAQAAAGHDINNNNTSLRAAINGGIDAGNFGPGKILLPSKLLQEGATNGQALVWNGTSWVPSQVAVVSLDKVVPYIYDRATTTVDVQNTAAETSIYTKSILANDMGTSRMLRLTCLGDYLHNNGAGDTLTVNVKFGGTTFYSNPGTLGAVTGAARHPWQLVLYVANLGAANSQMIEGQLGPVEDPNQSAPSTGIGQVLSSAGAQQRVAGLGISTPGAIDTTANQTLAVTVQWSASSANNSWRQRYAVLELV